MSIQEIEVARKTAPNFVAAKSDRDFGWEAYTAGWPIARLAKDDEKRGWWAALNAEALATMPAGMGEWEPGIEDDHAWIRKGC